MSSSINNNLMAANVANNLNSHYGKLETSVERISSGLRINSAADDAAGLAIRELMRANVASLNQGVRNANDAISMLQVADGALGIIDEKLIRMKELAEQAATGTYDSTQRLMIHSEFVAMAEEIDQIARATDFNGIKLLDGSLSGTHDGKGLTSTGKMKIHFGAANDSAEDYYYIEIGDCTLEGLGLKTQGNSSSSNNSQNGNGTAGSDIKNTIQMPPLNDCVEYHSTPLVLTSPDVTTLQKTIPSQGDWYSLQSWMNFYPDLMQNFIFVIPKGTKNIVINTWGMGYGPGRLGDQDIQLFTTYGKHLAGTPLDDFVYSYYDPGFSHIGIVPKENTIADQSDRLGFGVNDYDGSALNEGPPVYDPNCKNLQYTTYNGMTIGYSGDPDRKDAIPNDGSMDTWVDYEVLTIDEATEDLVFWYVGAASADIKAYWNLPDADSGQDPPQDDQPSLSPHGDLISIKTQEEAQQALTRIDDAIVAKDKVRAHLGALQNRLENTVTNLTVQAENLQAAEARISDADVAREMTLFVRNQILTQSAVAMLSQANSYPHMLSGLITG